MAFLVENKWIILMALLYMLGFVDNLQCCFG
ncbi:hypothetical protein JOD43_002835 [Pullulanibacillus pueri]|nr:hypothetical protein [Pullulanibacillus pueri]